MRNFSVLFLSDGTATTTPEMHAASLLNLRYGFARLLTCAEAEAELRRELGGHKDGGGGSGGTGGSKGS